ncbi:MAG: hypothetical protein RBR42_03725 [Desulfomicrobium sp.]|nr:hypothetical protein [Desulfomicrobium sp.]NLV96134.1 hypothetical protein [Desulfovibrionales bacterium]
MDGMIEELDIFFEKWASCDAKKAFHIFRKALESVDKVILDFKARPGVTYSLRGAHPHHQERELFVLIDIIDDDPTQRWLSVCFYNNMVSDPQNLGDWIPQGILGEDARCFDVDELDENFVTYVAQRIQEAGRIAALNTTIT